MEVTKSNIQDAVRQFQQLAATAEFCSLDLEMTGLYQDSVAEYQNTTLDSPEERYQNMRVGASGFTILQLGLCLAHRDPTTNELTFTPFNIYTFPRTLNLKNPSTTLNGGFSEDVHGFEMNGIMQLNTGAIEFNRDHGMDFQKWIVDGLPYWRSTDLLKIDHYIQKEMDLQDDYLNHKVYDTTTPHNERKSLNTMKYQDDYNTLTNIINAVYHNIHKKFIEPYATPDLIEQQVATFQKQKLIDNPFLLKQRKEQQQQQQNITTEDDTDGGNNNNNNEQNEEVYVPINNIRSSASSTFNWPELPTQALFNGPITLPLTSCTVHSSFRNAIREQIESRLPITKQNIYRVTFEKKSKTSREYYPIINIMTPEQHVNYVNTKKQELNTIKQEYHGVNEFWSILKQNNKKLPIVVHNGMFDLLFCYSHFEGKLPNTYKEFQFALSSVFPQVFDTKFIYSHPLTKELTKQSILPFTQHTSLGQLDETMANFTVQLDDLNSLVDFKNRKTFEIVESKPTTTTNNQHKNNKPQKKDDFQIKTLYDDTELQLIQEKKLNPYFLLDPMPSMKLRQGYEDYAPNEETNGQSQQQQQADLNGEIVQRKQRYHEAGYDAYVTGKVFAQLQYYINTFHNKYHHVFAKQRQVDYYDALNNNNNNIQEEGGENNDDIHSQKKKQMNNDHGELKLNMNYLTKRNTFFNDLFNGCVFSMHSLFHFKLNLPTNILQAYISSIRNTLVKLQDQNKLPYYFLQHQDVENNNKYTVSPFLLTAPSPSLINDNTHYNIVHNTVQSIPQQNTTDNNDNNNNTTLGNNFILPYLIKDEFQHNLYHPNTQSNTFVLMHTTAQHWMQRKEAGLVPDGNNNNKNKNNNTTNQNDNGNNNNNNNNMMAWFTSLFSSSSTTTTTTNNNNKNQIDNPHNDDDVNNLNYKYRPYHSRLMRAQENIIDYYKQKNVELQNILQKHSSANQQKVLLHPYTYKSPGYREITDVFKSIEKSDDVYTFKRANNPFEQFYKKIIPTSNPTEDENKKQIDGNNIEIIEEPLGDIKITKQQQQRQYTINDFDQANNVEYSFNQKVATFVNNNNNANENNKDEQQIQLQKTQISINSYRNCDNMYTITCTPPMSYERLVTLFTTHAEKVYPKPPAPATLLKSAEDIVNVLQKVINPSLNPENQNNPYIRPFTPLYEYVALDPMEWDMIPLHLFLLQRNLEAEGKRLSIYHPSFINTLHPNNNNVNNNTDNDDKINNNSIYNVLETSSALAKNREYIGGSTDVIDDNNEQDDSITSSAIYNSLQAQQDGDNDDNGNNNNVKNMYAKLKTRQLQSFHTFYRLAQSLALALDIEQQQRNQSSELLTANNDNNPNSNNNVNITTTLHFPTTPLPNETYKPIQIIPHLLHIYNVTSVLSLISTSKRRKEYQNALESQVMVEQIEKMKNVHNQMMQQYQDQQIIFEMTNGNNNNNGNNKTKNGSSNNNKKNSGFFGSLFGFGNTQKRQYHTNNRALSRNDNDDDNNDDQQSSYLFNNLFTYYTPIITSAILGAVSTHTALSYILQQNRKRELARVHQQVSDDLKANAIPYFNQYNNTMHYTTTQQDMQQKSGAMLHRTRIQQQMAKRRLKRHVQLEQTQQYHQKLHRIHKQTEQSYKHKSRSQ